MTNLNRSLLHAVPLALMAALVASCTNGRLPVQTVTPVNNPTLDASRAGLAARATALGLSGADSYVTPTEFEVLDAAGSPVANAVVTVAGQRLTTDARGVVELPAAVLSATDLQRATITANGFVEFNAKLLPGTASKLVALDSNRTALGSQGGRAANAAGNLEVVFPPGSLTGNTQVTVTRTYSAALQGGTPIPDQLNMKMGFKADNSDARLVTADPKSLPFLGEYGYHLDLGGQQLAPGSQIQVRFKTEGKFKEVLAKHIAKNDPMTGLTESVSQDANGDIWVTMAVQGPSLKSTPDMTVATAKSALAGAAAHAARALFAIAACGTWTDQEAHSTWIPEQLGGSAGDGIESDWSGGRHGDNAIGGATADEANARARTNCTDSSGLPMPGWITLMTHDENYNYGGNCVYFQFDPNSYECINGQIYTLGHMSTYYTDTTSQTTAAHVTWASDDSRFAGQPVAGALVSFNNAQSPVRTAPTSVYTDADGNASTVGIQNSNGWVSANVPGQPSPWSIGGGASYTVNCGTTSVSITKNKPIVTLATTTGGTATAQSLDWPTTAGALSGSAANPTFHPAIDPNAATVAFSSNGSQQPTSDSWVDVQGASQNIGWNQSTSLATSVWWSKAIAATLSYASNDATAPAGMRPASAWSGQSAANSNVTFSHAVSGAANKPASRGGDALAFTNVASASTWGLNGAAGTLTASHTSGPVTLTSGQVSYTVGGQTLSVGLNANLPEVLLNITGRTSGQTLRMHYRLTSAAGLVLTKDMDLPAPSPADHQIHVSLPVEEPVGNATTWTFQPLSISAPDWAVYPAAGVGAPFPALSGLYRSTVTSYTGLTSSLVAPK